MNEQDFLEAITRDPDDDVPRLIYADWLDERGDPRGEFIRVQCERASLDERDPRCVDLDFRERNLLAQYRNRWAKPLKKWGRVIQYRRGFVEDITVETAKFLESGEELLSLAPIRRLKLMKAKSHFEALAGCPLLKNLKQLNLRDCSLGLKRLETFLKSPWIKDLEGLDFSFNGWGPSALCEFARCETIGPLKHLALSACKIDSVALNLLLRSPRAGSLSSLELASNPLTNDDMRMLANCDHLGTLKSLNLEQNREITTTGFHTLLSSPNLSQLRALSLRNCDAGRNDDVPPAFPKDSPLKELVCLNLEGLWIRGDRLTQLAETSWVDNLVHLNLGENFAEPKNFSPLLKPGRLPLLRTLNLSVNKLKDQVVERLIEMGNGTLTDLNLAGNGIGNKGAKLLAESENFANLNILNLRGNTITDSGAHALAKSKTLGRITELRLTTTKSDASWNKFAGVSDDVKSQLIDRFGKHVCYFD